MNGDDSAAGGAAHGGGGPDPVKVMIAVNGVIASIGGTYASTHSLAVTIVAACVGVACTALFAWRRK